MAPPAAAGRFDLETFLVALLTVLAGSFLLANLRSYAGALLVWEPAVLEGFEKAFHSRQDVFDYFLQMLTWDDGLVSKGSWSLLYGAPTYALVTGFGFTPSMLRLAAVGAALATLLAGGFFGRRLHGKGGALALAGALAVSPPVLYYGRYGTSLAATTLTVLLAVALTILFLEAEDKLFSRALLLAGAMALATLHYAPGRLAVLFLLAFLPVGALLGPKENRGKKFGAIGVLTLCLAAFWGAQRMAGHASSFLQARGEQVFAFFTDRSSISSYLGREVEPRALTGRDKATIARNVALSRLPELLAALSPSLRPAAPRDVVGGDPPHLPFLPPPLLALALWGLLRSLRHPLQPRNLVPPGLAVAIAAPLLLTTRVDAHRLSLLAIPIALWAASGAVDLWRRVPRIAGGLAATVLLVASAPYVYLPLHALPRPDIRPLVASLSAAVNQAGRPVMLALSTDHTVVGLIQLQVLEMQRELRLDGKMTGPGIPSLVPERVINLLRQGSQEGREHVAEELVAVLAKAPVLLGPMQEFKSAGETLKKAGLIVTPAGTAEAPMLLVSHRSVPLRGSPESAAPTPASPLEMRLDRLVFLSDLPVLKQESDFAPPRMDTAWDGAPLTLAGEVYKKGIGMHARCSMTFQVPPGAVRFQARIGLGPGAASCPDAQAGFFVKDPEGNFLYSAPAVRFTDRPADISIPVTGLPEITLVASEGGNGRDCDHAAWALASFVVSPAGTTGAPGAVEKGQSPPDSRPQPDRGKP